MEKNREDIYCDIYNRISILKNKNSETLDILIDINNYIEELKEDEGEFDNNEDSSYDFGND